MDKKKIKISQKSLEKDLAIAHQETAEVENKLIEKIHKITDDQEIDAKKIEEILVMFAEELKSLAKGFKDIQKELWKSKIMVDRITTPFYWKKKKL
jgi:hexokinase